MEHYDKFINYLDIHYGIVDTGNDKEWYSLILEENDPVEFERMYNKWIEEAIPDE